MRGQLANKVETAFCFLEEKDLKDGSTTYCKILEWVRRMFIAFVVDGDRDFDDCQSKERKLR